MRQISITGNGRIKSGIVITNNFELNIEIIVRKYARRWLIEKTISQQIEFFYLNHVSSSMVIKVVFNLTMSLLAFNLYRLMALDFTRYEHLTAQTMYEKFILNDGDITIDEQSITVCLKKKRNLSLVLEKMKSFSEIDRVFLAFIPVAILVERSVKEKYFSINDPIFFKFFFCKREITLLLRRLKCPMV